MNDAPLKADAAGGMLGRILCAVAAATLVGGGAAPGEPDDSEQPDRPNLLLIMTDDQRWDAVGWMGKGPPRTPHLDRLAERGMVFTTAYCASMPCVPSRASVMTGLHHHRWPRGPRRGLGRGLSERAWTWTGALQRRGYRTALIGKMHFAPRHADHGFDVMQTCDSPPLGRGWDESPWHDDYDDWLKRHGLDSLRAGRRDWRGGIAVDFAWPRKPAQHPIPWVRRRAVNFLRRASERERPFAAIVSFRFPHPPIVPSGEYASMYEPSRVPVPQRGWSEMQNIPDRLAQFEEEGFRLLPLDEVQRLADRPIPDRYESTEELFRHMGAAYWGLCSQVDRAVGRLLKHVSLDRTLVIFTSDHGVYFGHRRRLFKDPLIPFEHLARVPFLAAGPGVPRGRRCENPVSLLDLAPTFLRAAGADCPERLDGRPLQPYFADPRHGAGRAVYCYGRDGFDMIRKRDVKYFRAHDGDAAMLFDLNADPREWHNLAGQPRWKGLQARLRERLEAVRGRPQVETDRETR